MANNYCKGSCMLPIPPDKLQQAKQIVKRMLRHIEDDEHGFCSCLVEVDEAGVWFHEEETLNPDHVELIARELVEKLKIDEPFYCSWAYTCSKPRIDEFGGGAFVIQRGKKTFWVNAMSAVRSHVAKRRK